MGSSRPRRPGAGPVVFLALVAMASALTVCHAAAELPPLIPRAQLFGNPVRAWPVVSPEGNRIAYLAPNDTGVLNIWIRTLGLDDARMVTQSERDDVNVFAWAWNGKQFLYLDDRNGDENLHLWSIDIETGQPRDLTPFEGARATNLITSAVRPNEVLIGLNRRDPRLFDMYRVDLETGTVSLDTENPGDVLSWTTDHEFEIRALNSFDPADGSSTVRVRDNRESPWRPLVRTEFTETTNLGQGNGSTPLLGFAPDGRSLYMGMWHGKDSDFIRVAEVDCATGRELRTLSQHPRCDLWTNMIPDGTARYAHFTEPASGALQAVGYAEDKLEWKAINPAVRKDLDFLAGKAAPGVFFLENQDRAGRKWVVSVLRPDAGQKFYLYDRDRQSFDFLFEDRPELVGAKLAPVEFMRIKARDGLSLPAYLTLPVGVPKRNLPLVVYVHGGPWTRDNWWYDPTVQWLANRGCAVLQVNFRGSIGFGRRYLNIATRELGGAMQNDLTDAVQWAIAEKIADPKRVAIMGGSYGGYATLAGLAFTPELYACGVDLVGPSNLATLLSSFPAYWAPVKKRWTLRVGDVETDDAFNRKISPLFHADKIRAPLFVAHGTNDPRCKQAESDAIVAAARKHGVPVTYIVYPDEGHGFGRTENNMDFFVRVEEFLAKHLGLRSEPTVVIEGSSAEVR